MTTQELRYLMTLHVNQASAERDVADAARDMLHFSEVWRAEHAADEHERTAEALRQRIARRMN